MASAQPLPMPSLISPPRKRVRIDPLSFIIGAATAAAAGFFYRSQRRLTPPAAPPEPTLRREPSLDGRCSIYGKDFVALAFEGGTPATSAQRSRSLGCQVFDGTRACCRRPVNPDRFLVTGDPNAK